MPTDYRVLRSAACDADIEVIFDHLFQSYRDLGDPLEDALNRAAARVRGIEDALAGLGDVPFQGTLVPQIMDGLRHVTKDQAVFYFISDDARRDVRVLGVFFGGQDHRRHILRRIVESER
ncbi:type II toxin-antitoxin system RelE/ParE family toxin [Tateyamaria omphalii]|uniref:type II toxin-antitoxin system RelE/ParE family toxin n=1 Tax=Tateyamaria omphalii TaxID=299262 RepID=UPI001C9A0F99|nr:type II toxin-antitoxin system RelE/ParE family toxin [Tateyamaria omphalii]MBY5935675.1 type II toxin-antitoxin system RelE/ParE family toxin [Tateyamaria omphalii]